MEPLMPSEVARLVFGYLKKEKFDELAESFLKSSPHLTECYEMYKFKGSFNTKVNGFDIYELFDLFGTMCRIINERVSEAHESKTMIERLLLLININHLPNKDNKCVETQTVLDMVDKGVGNITCTEDKNTQTTTVSTEPNKNAPEIFEIPSFSDIISDNVTKTNVFGPMNNEITSTIEKPFINSLPSPSSRLQLINNKKSTPIENASVSPKFQMNEQISSTPTKAVYGGKQILETSPKIIVHNQFISNQSECQQIPEATSLESMPGLSKEDKDPKDNSIVIDTGELIDTFLSDKSLLEKFADTINKSIECQKEIDQVQDGIILDPSTLEKALDSTQSEPQIKNVLDEFLVFNIDNVHNNKNINLNDQQNSIKYRLRNTKKSDDITTSKLKKNNLVNLKNNAHNNEEGVMVDNIVLLCNNNLSTAVTTNCDLLSNQFILGQTDFNVNQSHNSEIIEVDSEFEDYADKHKYRKIAPKSNSILKTNPVTGKRIYPKRKRRIFDEPGVRSQFRKTNITIQPPKSVHPLTPSIIIEVPNQSSLEKKNKTDECSVSLPEVSKISSEGKYVNKDATVHDTPGDILKPPKNKSLSTPRRVSTHIRCLDFSTPQPKNHARDQARSKLFFDSPNRVDKIVEESFPSPLPKLQGNWELVNGFEAIVKKDTTKDWDSDIREMVGAGILTSDADRQKTRKKKTPREKMKPVKNKKISIDVSEEQNESENLIQTNDETNKSNISENLCGSNKQTSNNSSFDYQNPPKKIPSEFPVPLETDDKITNPCNKQPPTDSSSSKSVNDKNPSIFEVPLETPKLDMCNELPLNAFPISFDTPVKTTDANKSQIKCNPNETQNKHMQPKISIYEQENNLNQLNTSTVTNKLTISSSKTLPESNKSLGNDSNLLETFSNHKSTESVIKQTLELIETNSSIEFNSPENNIVKPNIETPFKCDESAVDIPETPISKLIREYDPSKLVTPLPSTPVHYEDSLTDTPISKIFRETSYLNRPPVSPFPPTPGNSMSVDTLIVPLEQECSKFSSQLNGFLNNDMKFIVKQPIQVSLNDECKEQKKKIEPTPSKTKKTDLTKIKSDLNAKNKQAYESVKNDLFGSEISSSSSADDIEISKIQPKTIVINKNPNEKERKSGFKPIPKRKSILSTSSAFSSVEKHSSNETNSQLLKSSIKSTVIQIKKSSMEEIKKTSNTKQSMKSKKSMVHFDDPVEQSCVSPIKPTPCNSKYKIVSKIDNNIVTNKNSDQSVGLSRCLESSSRLYEHKQSKSSFEAPKLDCSGSSAEVCIADVSMKKKSNFTPCILGSSSKMHNMTNKERQPTGNCIIDKTKKEDSTEKMTEVSLSDISSMTKINNVAKSSENCASGKDENYCKKKEDATLNKLNQFESILTDHSMNTSLVSNIHDDNSFQLMKDINTLVDKKRPKQIYAYEIINDDDSTANGSREMVYLSKSEVLTFLDLPSESNNVQFSSLINPSSKINKELNASEKEIGELVESDDDIIDPVTSTSKNIPEKNIVEKQKYKEDKYREDKYREDKYREDKYREGKYREDKHREDKHRNPSVWSRNNYRDNKYDKKYRPNKSRNQDEQTQFDSRNRFKNSHDKREYCHDRFGENNRLKHKNDKKHSSRDFNRDDDRRERDRLEERELSSIGPRMSQKLNKTEDAKKTTKRPIERSDHSEIPAKMSKVEHQRLLKNVNVDHFLSVVHGQK